MSSRPIRPRSIAALLVAVALGPTVAACGDDDGDPFDDGSCICPEVFAPVCGVDGVTYSNDCFAACEGVEVERDGRCEDPPGS